MKHWCSPTYEMCTTAPHWIEYATLCQQLPRATYRISWWAAARTDNEDYAPMTRLRLLRGREHVLIGPGAEVVLDGYIELQLEFCAPQHGIVCFVRSGEIKVELVS